MRDIQLLVLIALAGRARHGHAIRGEIEELSGAPVGPGTLYGAIGRLEDAGLIRALGPRGRRRPYETTEAGRAHLTQRMDEMRRMVTIAEPRLEALSWTS